MKYMQLRHGRTDAGQAEQINPYDLVESSEPDPSQCLDMVTYMALTTMVLIMLHRRRTHLERRCARTAASARRAALHRAPPAVGHLLLPVIIYS